MTVAVVYEQSLVYFIYEISRYALKNPSFTETHGHLRPLVGLLSDRLRPVFSILR